MARYTVGIYYSMSNHVPSINPHASTPDWLGMDSPFLGDPLCNPKGEPPVHSPSICTDIQNTITGFLGYNHPHGSQFCPLAALTIPLIKPDCLSRRMVCYCSPLARVALAGPICLPSIFRDRIFPLLNGTLLWWSNQCFFWCITVICHWA